MTPHRLLAGALAFSILFSLPAQAQISFPFPGLSLPIPGLSIPIPFIGRSGSQNPQDQQFQDLANEGSRRVKAGDAQGGIEYYRRALAIYPNNPSVRVNLGNACIKAGRPDEAAVELKRAISVAPNLDLAWLDLVAAYTTGNRLEMAIGAGKEFLRRFPGNRHTATVTQEVDNASKELQRRRRAVSRDPGAGANSDNYLALACDYGLARWPLAKMPLNVYIDEGRHVRKHKDDFNYQVTRAFDQWSLASAGMIRFKQTADPKQADINVMWTDGSDIPNITELGEARFDDVRDHEIRHITIMLLTQAPRIHKELSARDIFSVAMHEIGHALGIHGHSDGQRDIMFFCDTPVSQVISMRDANTLQRLYTAPVTLFDTAIALQKLGGTPPGINDLQREPGSLLRGGEPPPADPGAFSQSTQPTDLIQPGAYPGSGYGTQQAYGQGGGARSTSPSGGAPYLVPQQSYPAPQSGYPAPQAVYRSPQSSDPPAYGQSVPGSASSVGSGSNPVTGSAPSAYPAATAYPAPSAYPAGTADHAPSGYPAATADHARSGYPAATAYPVPSGYPAATAYPAPSGYPAATAYPAPSGYPAATAYPAPSGYPAATAYPASSGYSPAAAYPAPSGYPAATAYPVPTGYPSLTGYPPSGAYPANSYQAPYPVQAVAPGNSAAPGQPQMAQPGQPPSGVKPAPNPLESLQAGLQAGLQAAIAPVVKEAARAANAVNDTFAPYSANPEQGSPFGAFVKNGVDAIKDAASKD